MNEEQSDIQLKIEDKLIPAHKQVLIEKSKYFANLFKSNMTESRQEVIEINDCEYAIFIEFLQFIYCEKVQFESEQVALKLLILTDKYLQTDLNEKCMDFLMSNLNSNNAYVILDFARQYNIYRLKNWCMEFLKNNLTITSVSGLIQYLSQQKNQEFAHENLELSSKALNFVTDHYAKLCQEDAKFYEEFLIQNINIDTIVLIANFIYTPRETLWNMANETFQQDIDKIKNASLAFAAKNFKQLVEKGTDKDLPQKFLSDLVLYFVENRKESI